MSSNESRVHSWGNQHEELVPFIPTYSSSLHCQGILTLVPISVVNPRDLGHLRNTDPSSRDNEDEEMDPELAVREIAG